MQPNLHLHRCISEPAYTLDHPQRAMECKLIQVKGQKMKIIPSCDVRLSCNNLLCFYCECCKNKATNSISILNAGSPHLATSKSESKQSGW